MYILSIICLIFSLAFAPSCGSGTSGGGTNNGDGDDGTETTATTAQALGAEDATFQEIAMAGGISFTIGDFGYTTFGATIKKFSADTVETVFNQDGTVLDCVSTFNAEAMNGKGYILGGDRRDVDTCAETSGSSDEVWKYDPDANTLPVSDYRGKQ